MLQSKTYIDEPYGFSWSKNLWCSSSLPMSKNQLKKIRQQSQFLPWNVLQGFQSSMHSIVLFIWHWSSRWSESKILSSRTALISPPLSFDTSPMNFDTSPPDFLSVLIESYLPLTWRVYLQSAYFLIVLRRKFNIYETLAAQDLVAKCPTGAEMLHNLWYFGSFPTFQKRRQIQCCTSNYVSRLAQMIGLFKDRYIYIYILSNYIAHKHCLFSTNQNQFWNL